MKMNWTGGADGGLELPDSGEVVLNIDTFPEFVRAHYQDCSGDTLECFGAIGLFFMLRDFGRESMGSILESSRRALDSFYLVTGSPEADHRIDLGVNWLLENLVPYRSDGFQVLIDKAFKLIEKRWLHLFEQPA